MACKLQIILVGQHGFKVGFVPQPREGALLNSRTPELLNCYLLLAKRYDFDRTMVVTMIAVRMVQVAIHEIVDVIAVGHSLMPAIRTVYMRRLVTPAFVVRCAVIRVLRTDFQGMLLHKRGASGSSRMV